MDSTLGTIVRGLRKQNHLTLKDLSELTGLSFAQIGKIERGEAKPKRETIEKIADVLSYESGELLRLAGYHPVLTTKEEAGFSFKDRYKVLLKFKSTCQICGAQAPNTPIEVTFADPQISKTEQVSFDDLITLCINCLTARDAISKEERDSNQQQDT